MDVVTLAAEFPNDNPALHGGVSWLCLELTGPPVAVREATVVLAAAEERAEEPERAEARAKEPEAPLVDAARQEEPVLPAARISEICAVGARDDADDDDALEDDGAILVEELPPLDDTAIVEGPLEIAPPVLLAPLARTVGEGFGPCETTLPPACDDAFTVLLGTLTDIAIGAGSPHVAAVLGPLLLEGTLPHAMPDDAAQALAEGRIADGLAVSPVFVAQCRAWRAILCGTSDDFDACGGAMLDEWAAELLARLLGAASRAPALKRELRSRGVAAFGLVEAA